MFVVQLTVHESDFVRIRKEEGRPTPYSSIQLGYHAYMCYE